MSEKIEYILGTHSEELERLGFQHRVWADDAHASWRRGNIRRGHDVLDIGCGPGFASFDLAQLVGQQGSVTGVDRSQAYIQFADHRAQQLQRDNLRFIHSEFSEMDLGRDRFDAAYSRWVFSWTTDVQPTLEKIVRSLRPGGVFVLQEYLQWGTFRLVPEKAEFRTMIEACRESWRRMESEIDIGQQLPSYLTALGMQIEHVRPLERTARVNSLTWQWPTGFLRIYSKQLMQMGLLTPDDVNLYLKALPEIEQREDAFIVTPLMVEIIALKK